MNDEHIWEYELDCMGAAADASQLWRHWSFAPDLASETAQHLFKFLFHEVINSRE